MNSSERKEMAKVAFAAACGARAMNPRKTYRRKQDIHPGDIVTANNVPIFRVVRVNRCTVTVDLWNPTKAQFYTPSRKYRYFDLHNTLCSLEHKEWRIER